MEALLAFLHPLVPASFLLVASLIVLLVWFKYRKRGVHPFIVVAVPSAYAGTVYGMLGLGFIGRDDANAFFRMGWILLSVAYIVLGIPLLFRRLNNGSHKLARK